MKIFNFKFSIFNFKRITPFLKGFLIFVLIIGWLFSGWPRIWQEPPIPPEIQVALAYVVDDLYSFTTQAGSDTGWDYWQTVTGAHSVQPENTASNWCWTDTGSTSSSTGPPSGVPCVYTETSSPVAVDEEFTMTLTDAISAVTYGLYATFDTCTQGNTSAHLYFEAYNGSTWDAIDDWAGDAVTTFTSRGPYDFTSYTNSDFKIRFRTVVAGTTYTNDMAIDEVRIYGDTKNEAPSITVSQPDGVDDTVTAGTSYDITYTLSDPDSVATVDFYYDADDTGTDGTAISECQDQAEENTTCSWDTTGLAGSYYVYGTADDGVNDPVSNYSEGPITIKGSSGTVLSTEVDFDWTGETSWGEVIWNTTEPEGSNVLLKVYYDPDKTEGVEDCDTIIPDVDLTIGGTANSDGFDNENFSSLNISGLNTTDYNRICLRAELTIGTAESSPTLDDWKITWEPPAGNQAPEVTPVSLNGGSNIDLEESTTVSVSATATVTDPDGYSDISSVQGKIYRSGVSGAQACTNNANNCYENTVCDLSGCADTSCTATCTINMQFHADPTDTGTPWTAEYWRAWVEATDSQSQTGENWSPADAPEVNSLLALDLDPSYNSIAYGSLNPGDITDPLVSEIRVRATGNCALDVYLYGTNMTKAECTDIPVGNERWGFGETAPTWGSCSDNTLELSSSTRRELNCCKTDTTATPEWKRIWWGIEIPTPQESGENYSGTNTVEAEKNQWSGAGDWCE